ncbi:MAG: hypothetical protein FD146_328 [Anaerolineaceae bacterium]|nr:MAG: hypothetical protein FD146_328 [Anaerolineaceae bacterium]
MNPILSAARGLKNRLDFAAHPWARSSLRQLTAMQDTHKGERCFIIGNGPSLRDTDLTKLSGEFTFGMNRIYLLFPELGFHTTYFVSVNYLVIRQCAAEIMSLPMPKFIPWSCRRDIGRPSADTIFLDLVGVRDRPGFYADPRQPIWHGATVTYVALQLAYFLGFGQAILIGVDHDFASKGPAGQVVTSQGDDPNHFAANYFGKGFQWQLPDLETSEIAYRFARQAYEKAGRQVLDATVGGKLTIFEKVDYLSLFK